MRKLLFATLLATTTLVAQQIPIPAFSVTSTAPLARGFWFQAPVDFVITGLRVPNEAGQPVQAVEVIDLGTQAPPSFPATTLGTQLFYANNQPSNQVLATSIAVTATRMAQLAAPPERMTMGFILVPPSPCRTGRMV